MSSATSTEEPGLRPVAQSAADEDPGLRPWQFFLLAGMLSATAVVLLVAGQSPASIIVLSLTVVAASLVALGAYRSFAPLVVPTGIDVPPPVVGRARAALEREKALALRSIKELEFDYAMKKMGKADFDELSAKLRTRAIGLMRQLDEGGGYRAEIEREVRARLERTAGPGFSPASQGSASTAGDVPDAQPEGRARKGCQCGTANDADARYCKSCGERLNWEGGEGTERVEEVAKATKGTKAP